MGAHTFNSGNSEYSFYVIYQGNIPNMCSSQSYNLDSLRLCEWIKNSVVEKSQTLKRLELKSCPCTKSSSPLTPRDVKVEEVAVENGLHDAGHHGDLVEEALGVVAPHPVGYVEGSVEAEEEQVVSGDGLGLAGLCDHEELRHYGHRLQEDGEGPQDLDMIRGRETHRLTLKPEVLKVLGVYHLGDPGTLIIKD